MTIFLILAYLFFLGSQLGWNLEFFFRKFFSASNPEHKWVNPGFCMGPYLPLYGFGLCALYLLASFGDRFQLSSSTKGTILLFLVMAAAMTIIEYLAGLMCLKLLKIRLWDYRHLWGNIQGLICPLFSFFWALLGAIYYFFVHHYILDALNWLANNLAFSFVIGFFFGVFTIDVVYSGEMVAKLRAFANEHEVVVRYESLKLRIQEKQMEARGKIHFLLPLKTPEPIHRHLKEFADYRTELRQEVMEDIRKHLKK